MTILKLLVLLLVSVPARGYALSLLWMWFIAKPFAVNTISWPHAAGLGLILGLALDPKRDVEQNYASAMLVALLTPAFVVLCGWILANLI